MSYQHPAHTMPFAELLAGLETEVASKFVNAKDGPNGLRMYSYSDRCVYEKAWTPFSLMARGLILHPETEKIVAIPFVKFFNYGERADQTIPDEPFEVFEKLDGSLIIIYHAGGKWNAATRGSFTSSQANWAQAILDGDDLSLLLPGVTYLAEAVYPENRIVISYERDGLVMLAGFHEDGFEVPYQLIAATAHRLCWEFAEPFSYASITELLAELPLLPGDEEGFVLRFASGLRLKFKGEEYRRLHKCIAGVTPLGVWEALRAGDDALRSMRQNIPEEFWQDFDTIAETLSNQMETILRRVRIEYAKVCELSDKDLGLNLEAVPEDVRGWMFSYRNSGGKLLEHPKYRLKTYELIRPTGNRLDGYRPSSAMNRVQSEE